VASPSGQPDPGSTPIESAVEVLDLDRTPVGGASSRQAVRAWLRARPLRTRLVAILVLVLLMALTASGYAAQSLLRTYLTDQVDAALRGNARNATIFAIRAAEASDDPLRPYDDRRGVPGGYVVRYWTTTTTPLTYPAAPANGGPSFPDLSRSLEPGNARLITVQAADGGGGSWRVYAFTIPGNTGTDYLYAQVALPFSAVDETVNKLRSSLLIFGLAVVLCGALLGALAIRRAFRPLLEVEQTAAAIAAGDLSRRIPERPRSTEVGRLTASLNTMLSHIESAFRAREASEGRTRRFAADASHELRTPLASIRGFAELYRQGAVPADDVPRTMRRIEDEATRMGGLVEDLLLLARLDEQRPGRAEPVDLTVLAADAVHDAKGLDPTRPVQLVGLRPGAGPGSTAVIGDEDRLRQVVANLVANAVRHTPSGTAVEVAVGVEPATGGAGPVAVLEVRDHGPGLTPQQSERIFERFYRVDSSRQRGRGGGSGLGLSIVSAVVSAHGGRVGVRMTSGGGATFRVALPVARDGAP
jgi:two-component system OmpR family sensor kinase